VITPSKIAYLMDNDERKDSHGGHGMAEHVSTGSQFGLSVHPPFTVASGYLAGQPLFMTFRESIRFLT
jgi:hypothetical protein